jgi:hypothetical protein
MGALPFFYGYIEAAGRTFAAGCAGLIILRAARFRKYVS